MRATKAKAIRRIARETARYAPGLLRFGHDEDPTSPEHRAAAIKRFARLMKKAIKKRLRP